jgi:hypothetical protein
MFRVRNNLNSLGSTSTPAVLCPCIPNEKENIQLHTIFVQACQLLWLVILNEAYGNSFT